MSLQCLYVLKDSKKSVPAKRARRYKFTQSISDVFPLDEKAKLENRIPIFIVAISTTHRFHCHASVLEGVGRLQNLEEIFVFRGNCAALPVKSSSLLSKCLEKAKKVKVLMLWDLGAIGDHPVLAGSIRAHPALERVTLTLPGGLPYSLHICRDFEKEQDASVVGFGGYDHIARRWSSFGGRLVGKPYHYQLGTGRW